MAKKKRKNKKSVRQAGPSPYPGIEKHAEFEEYGLFMALDHVARKKVFGFITDEAFAKAKDVEPSTLSRWKYKPELWEVRDKYMIHFKKNTAAIISKLAARAAKTGEAFHTLTYMKLVEGYSEKAGLDLTSKGKKISGFKVIVHHANKTGGGKFT